VERRRPLGLGPGQQYPRGIAEARRLEDREGNAQRAQGLGEGTQVSRKKGEAISAYAMGLPLRLGLKKYGVHGPRGRRRSQGSMIRDPKVVAKPNQLEGSHGVS
jgi:hypothetical protein